MEADPRQHHRFVKSVARRLERSYEYDNLGNQSDPLDELVYILLSTRTRGSVFERTFRELKSAYPTWDKATRRSKRKLLRILGPAGLAEKKVSWLLEILDEVKRREGKASLNRLRAASDAEVESYLTSLPGVGVKTARCVMMYSLNRDVFPVDANVRRLFERLGLLDPRVHYHKAHDAAQDLVPARWRHSLHVFAVIHGRTTCLPRSPKCDTCCLINSCAASSVGKDVAHSSDRR